MLPGFPLIVFPLPLPHLLLLWLIVSKPLQLRYWARYQHHHWGRALSLEGEKDRHDSRQEREGERSGREKGGKEADSEVCAEPPMRPLQGGPGSFGWGAIPERDKQRSD